MFKSNGLKITIDANKKIVLFLDVTFDLTDGSYKLYMKPNNELSYVHRQRNHPPALLKNIPLNINKRLTNISSSKEVFDESIAPYQHALKESGYDHKLTYNPEPAPKNKRRGTIPLSIQALKPTLVENSYISSKNTSRTTIRSTRFSTDTHSS